MTVVVWLIGILIGGNKKDLQHLMHQEGPLYRKYKTKRKPKIDPCITQHIISSC